MDKTLNTLNLKKLFSDFSSAIFQKKEINHESIEKKQLLSEIEEALSDLRHAKNCFEDARDPEMIEACVYEIKSAEARYSFLLRKVKLMSIRNTEMSFSSMN